MYRKSILLLLSLFVMSIAHAQTIADQQLPKGENFEVPDGWEIRLDRPDDSITVGSNPDSADIYFVTMNPGWHLRTGPRGIFYNPANKTSGDITIHTKLHLFNPNGRNREGFGLFFGGKALKDAEIEYVYFLIRNTGDFLIKRRIGESTELIKDWAASDNIVIYDDPELSSVVNSLSVSVENSMLTFFINGTEVAHINADEFNVSSEGIFGLRVNHAINLHVEELGIETE